MPFHAGDKIKRTGRPKGSTDKRNLMGREAIKRFVDRNAYRLEKWLDDIAKESPRDAFNAFMSVVEYSLPKMQRTEVTGKDGEKLNLIVNTGVIMPSFIRAELEKQNDIDIPLTIDHQSINVNKD